MAGGVAPGEFPGLVLLVARGEPVESGERYGTVWFDDPGQGVAALAFSQCSCFLFRDARDCFMSLI